MFWKQKQYIILGEAQQMISRNEKYRCQNNFIEEKENSQDKVKNQSCMPYEQYY